MILSVLETVLSILEIVLSVLEMISSILETGFFFINSHKIALSLTEKQPV
jgi:hypothetical protein